MSFVARRERYTSGSGPFSRLRVPGRLLMYHDSTRQRDCKTGCWSMTEASFQAIRWSSLTACSAKALVSMSKLTVDNIILLLDMCLSATYLQFQQECYQQTHGTAMGSPVSVTVANLVMEDVEQRALSTFRGRCPLFWKRYVDDTCTAIHPEEIEDFHSHLNSIEPSIQFTKEIQQDNKLPFLDINLMKEDDGTISTSVYRKKTHTDQYLQFTIQLPINKLSSGPCSQGHPDCPLLLYTGLQKRDM